MAIINFPFNSISNDRLYSAEDIAGLFEALLTNGIVTEKNGEPGFNVSTDGTNMVLSVAPGAIIINGRGYIADEAQELTIPTADTSLNRIDSIILELDMTQRAIVLKVVPGIAASIPTPIQLTKTKTNYQMELAQVYVSAGVTYIGANNITDSRANSDRCGLITKGILDSTVAAELQKITSKLISSDKTYTDSNNINYEVDYAEETVHYWGVWPAQAFPTGSHSIMRALPIPEGYTLDYDEAAIQLTGSGYPGTVFFAGALKDNSSGQTALNVLANNTNATNITVRIFYDIRTKLIKG